MIRLAPYALRLRLSEEPIVAGAGDNAAGAVGIVAINPNQAFLSLGTSGIFCC
ncbi:hypothetical protein [Shewanella aestuarii]|uniref:hypothetical protein n=1 Tax=Shewanella aestuarii TaxID=1028752 RepID=UPI003D77ECB9